jgi:hypothetical protein
MKNLKKTVLVFLLATFTFTVNAQVLITLLLGDALNTDKIEFGLSGGMTHSYIGTINNSEGMNTFDLGFYFHSWYRDGFVNTVMAGIGFRF